MSAPNRNPIPGETKKAFCTLCGKDTLWEYIVVQHEDALLGLQNAIDPELLQVRRWRCTEHTTPDGKLLEAFKHPVHVSHHPEDHHG